MAIADAGRERLTLDDALGLIEAGDRTLVIPPRSLKVAFVTDAAIACLKELDELVHEHRELPIVVWNEYTRESREILLGALDHGFPPAFDARNGVASEDKCPHRQIWESWKENRGKRLRDSDGLELLRADVWANADRETFFTWSLPEPVPAEHQKVAEILSSGKEFVALRYRRAVSGILSWLVRLDPPTNGADFLLDAVEASFALAPEDGQKGLLDLAKNPIDLDHWENYKLKDMDWRERGLYRFWLQRIQGFASLPLSWINEGHRTRLWQLLHWRDEPVAGAPRKRPSYALLNDAYTSGAAADADWFDELLGARKTARYGTTFESFSRLTARRPKKEDRQILDHKPEIAAIVDRCRHRVLEIELARGEEATPATRAALDLRSSYGIDLLLQILAKLGKTSFKVVSPYTDAQQASRSQVLTHLAGISYPNAQDDRADFVLKVKAAIRSNQFPEERILELAFHAPQWSQYVEAYFGWPGFCEALYWMLAHMSYIGNIGEQAAIGAESPDEAKADEDEQTTMSAGWSRLITERTPLSEKERREGAVDIQWFHKVYALLKPKQWEAMSKAARYASTPAAAKRAQFVADVLLGKASRKELIEGIRKRFLKENVRLFGLLPLAKGEKRDKDVAERYKVLVEYRKYAKQLSAMSKEDAVRAAEVGFQNLARTAGYADPLRLEWAMEAESVKDLAKGSVEAERDGVTVRLELDESSRPTLTVRRGEKELKSIPPEIKKKDKAIAALAERVPELKRQSARMRQSLEAAMCRGDTITPAELLQLCDHALLKPMLSRLVFVGEGILGYPDKGGKALRNSAGKLEPIKKSESLRIAHSHDLFASGDWDAWQKDCFQAERVQPFKQIFRELYVVTKQEKSDGTLSRRYAGQQVNPSQATALWGQRGWSTKDCVWKTFYDVGITTSVGFNYGITTPLEVEGWTIETVQFTQRDSYERLKLTAVPPRIFSEVMRDLDLVVSVAHRGEVDPEASASTVEMRANLLDETCRLLQFKNVRIKNQHALVDGELGKYSVHLGSAVVHKMPGGSLCIVPVHAQHRGRLFLPFADDDPKTAEVISKVLLLARDGEIQDPIILDQLRHVGV